MEIMEFEKLQQIIAEVLNIDPEEITMNTKMCIRDSSTATLRSRAMTF